jgi:hypothetical protein
MSSSDRPTPLLDAPPVLGSFASTSANRSLAWIAALLTTLVALAAEVVGVRATDHDLLSLTFKMIVPVGAALLGVVAMSGFALAHRLRPFRVDGRDFGYLLALALGLQVAAYGVLWLLPATPGGPSPASTMSYSHFAYLSITQSMLTVSDARFGTVTAPIGEFGWFVLVPRLAVLMALAKITQLRCGGGTRGYGPR